MCGPCIGHGMRGTGGLKLVAGERIRATMRRPILGLALAATLAASACTSSNSTQPSTDAAWPPPPRPELSPVPAHIKVQHVLIAFRGSGTSATRSRDEAEKLARDVYTRAVKGESFEPLMKLSDDTGGGTYAMCNQKIDLRPMEIPRQGMVKGFGDVSFSLNVGEIGVCAHDPRTSPYGWHIVKRIE
jgi:hypothetical protein